MSSAFELVPLDAGDGGSGWELAPIEPEQPSVLRNVALNNPLTAIGETVASLGSQMVALPVAGLVGIGTAAAKAIGLTDTDPAAVVESVTHAGTYQPRGEMGRAATAAAMMPFEKLAELGQGAGNRVLDTTGSPTLATVVDTAINAAPMAISPGVKAGKSMMTRGLLNHHPNPSPQVLQRLLKISPDEAGAYFDAWQADRTMKGRGLNETTVSPVSGGVQRLVADEAALHEPIESRLEALRGQGDQGLPALAGEFQQLPDGRWAEAAPETVAGAPGRERGLRADELPLAGTEVPRGQSPGLSQGGIGRGGVEYRGSGAAAGDLPEHLQASAIETGDVTGGGVLGTDHAAWRAEASDFRGTNPEPRGMGAGGRHIARDTSGAAQLRDSHGSGVEPGAAFAESTRRADRILTEAGSLAGWIDHYNRHIPDGRTIEAFSRQPDGSHILRIADGGATTTATVSAPDLPRYLEILRDPAKIAEMNQGDIVLGKRVRELDDATLNRWQGMVSLTPGARAKVGRELQRRQVTSDFSVSRLSKELDEAAHRAATSPLNDIVQPTPAQIEAGTYQKGHLKLDGLDIAIENPKGSIRRGVGADGKAWQTEMQHHYGYIKRTLARDGDHVDVFIGDRPEANKAFVIDQIDPKSGKYDEPKVILGALDEADALRIYHSNYEPGWKGMGAITPMDIEAFKTWVRSADAKKPAGLLRIAGKAVTEFDDAALASMAKAPTLSMSARAKVHTEIERRAAGVDFPEAPVRDQIGEANAVQEMAAGIQNGTWSPGANYQGFVDQVRAPSTLAKTVADLPAPLRREQIVTDLAKALDTTIYEGRVKGKNRLGFFRPGVHEVRIKHANDIEVAAHEVAHLIDRRVPELANTWRGDKALREELKSVSYDQKSVPEGFAEGMRLFLTQPDVLEARAPKVFAWLNGFTDSHRYGPALRQAQEQMVGWFGQDALNRARSKIGTDKPLAEYFDRFWDKFRQSIVDDLHGIYRMERDLTGKVSPNGPYESASVSEFLCKRGFGYS